jgi:glycosyltransferase involved in cell wall biosynthesis
MKGRVLIVHFRVGKTDGVSIEIANWKRILESCGLEVRLCAGEVSEGADYVVDKLECQLDPAVFELDNEAFGGYKHITEDQFLLNLRSIQNYLGKQFARILDEYQPDRVIVSNLFSVGLNVAAAGALAEELKSRGVLTIAVNHDFWWEDVRYRRPSGVVVEELLEKYFPPVGEWVRQVVINSIAKKDLAERKGVVADVLYDCMDMVSNSDEENLGCREMLKAFGVTGEDLVVLQATRIVRRKNIEIAMDVVKEMEKYLDKLGKKRVVLVMAGYAEKRDVGYLETLRKYGEKLRINIVELNGMNNSHNGQEGKRCGLMDIYKFADLVTYPSGYEGFGNQFLEAVWAKKPIVVYEYPVYKTDIKPLGFEVVSLGDELKFDAGSGLVSVNHEVIEKCCAQVAEVISNQEIRKNMVEKNFEIAKENFSFEAAKKVWLNLLK